MFILDFMRYYKGYVRFSAEGDFTERFLNLTAKNRIPIWDGRKSGGTYSGCAGVKNYKKLRACAKKSGVRIRVMERHGVPFKKYKYRKRKGILLGLAVFSVFLFVMSRFIWRIQVGGSGELPESTVIQALENIGISPGTLRSSIDVRDSERRALLLLHDISWIALNIDGSTIYVEYSPSDLPPKMVDPGTPCNIIAAESGHITTLNVFEGQALVTKGDTVMKGDLIVSGITQDGRGQNLFKHAKAQVVARISREISIEVPLNQTEYKETGETRSRAYIRAAGFDIPLFAPLRVPRPYHVERSQERASVFSIPLPISILKENYALMQEIPVTLTNDQARKQALLELEATEKSELAEAEIFSKEINVSTENGCYILNVRYDCAMDIAREREIIIGEG